MLALICSSLLATCRFDLLSTLRVAISSLIRHICQLLWPCTLRGIVRFEAYVPGEVARKSEGVK